MNFCDGAPGTKPTAPLAERAAAKTQMEKLVAAISDFVLSFDIDICSPMFMTMCIVSGCGID